MPIADTKAATVQVSGLTKVYTIRQNEGGLARAVFGRKKTAVAAVDGISFQLSPGEIVGFLGPNGAGKTTTLKMLSGLLYPTSGDARVLGHVPWKREASYLRRMTLVMGQRNQLVWDIPPLNSFELNRVIYRVPDADYRRILNELTELLELGPLLHKPVRNLSLGERMKCEIAAALLHRPSVVFLDEPTIGLDVTMQRRIRAFIKEYNRRFQATILLTSHYMADVQALSKRVIVIHRGRLLFDGELAALVQKFTEYKTVVVQIGETEADLSAYGQLVSYEGGNYTLRVPRDSAAHITERLLADLPVVDLLVQEPPLEEIIERVFAQGKL
jgi:ABC-2 type transport system ATP-binding protein